MKNQNFVRNLVGTAILAALVLALQLLLGSLKLGPFNITLTLVPIILGAVLYGPLSAAFLGGLFGFLVCISVISGNDAGGFMLFSQKPVITLALCMIKSTAAGYLSSLVVRSLAKKNATLSLFLAAGIAPVVNTGIFILGLLLFFQDTLVLWANGQDKIVDFLLFSILGINFTTEFLVNLVLVPILARILRNLRFVKQELAV